MCGILVCHDLPGSFSQSSLKSLRKRGPDEIGFWVSEKTRLGHARLSVIGLDERAAQPMDGETHVLSYNGEIYNFIDLKQRLEGRGVRFRGLSDTEVLLKGWQELGPAILAEMTGFWAFAIVDKQAQKLTLVRDQLGIKPLYYWISEGKVCASSMLRTIVQQVPRSLDLDTLAMSEYVLYQFTFGDKTFFKQIRKVLPGHMVTIDLISGEVTDVCYDDILNPRDHAKLPLDEDWIRTTRDLLSQCVVDSTISDTSFTTFCSGGLDSSLITRIASPDVAYHCNYSDPECNETFYAKQVVDQTDTRLFVVNAEEEFDIVNRLRDIVSDFDELSIGSVILPLDDLLSQVKRRYKVILTGTGGDELFGGYVRFQLAMGECYQDSYKALYERTRKLPNVVDRFQLTHRKGNPQFYPFFDQRAEESFREAYNQCGSGDDDLLSMLCFDRRYFLQGLLNIDDKMCGRHSLEGRPSFLHQSLIRHVQQLDPHALFDTANLKHVLRKIASGILPGSVIHRNDKMGFTTPIGTFVNQSTDRIREQITNSPFRDYYDLRRMNLAAENKFSRETFGLLMLDLWLNEYAGGRNQAWSR